MQVRRWLAALAIGGSALALAGCGAAASTNDDPSNVEAAQLTANPAAEGGITATGTGTVAVQPDLAVVTLGVTSEAATVQEARDREAEIMSRILNVVDGYVDDPDRDVRTQEFNIRSQHDAGRSQAVGYEVAHQLQVQVRAIDRVGEMVADVAEAGGDVTRVQGVAFTVEDPAEAERAARSQAHAQLRDRAEQAAALEGVTLGTVLELEDHVSDGAPPRPVPAMESADAGPAPSPVTAGQVEVSVSITARYAIE